MSTYQLGESVRFTATISTSTGVETDPTTVTISIKQPNGIMAVTAQNMTKLAIGSYYYDYTVPAESAGVSGTYKVKVTATGTAGRVTIKPDTFKVEASI